jgi:nucleoside permease NupC
MFLVSIANFSAIAIAHAGLRATVRGSSKSSPITSLGEGVAVISVTPSAE